VSSETEITVGIVLGLLCGPGAILVLWAGFPLYHACRQKLDKRRQER
jgi:hypothetical protein